MPLSTTEETNKLFANALSAFAKGGYKFSEKQKPASPLQQAALEAYIQGIKEGNIAGYDKMPAAMDMVRNFYVAIGGTGKQADIYAAYQRADAYVARVQEIARNYLKQDYANFNPIDPKQRRPKDFQPASFRNILETAMKDARDNFGFGDIRPDDKPPPEARIANIGNGQVRIL